MLGRVLWSLRDSRNSGGASSPRATATGGAWVHTPQREMLENGWVWLNFFSSSPSSDLATVVRGHWSRSGDVLAGSVEPEEWTDRWVSVGIGVAVLRLLALWALSCGGCRWRADLRCAEGDGESVAVEDGAAVADGVDDADGMRRWRKKSGGREANLFWVVEEKLVR